MVAAAKRGDARGTGAVRRHLFDGAVGAGVADINVSGAVDGHAPGLVEVAAQRGHARRAHAVGRHHGNRIAKVVGNVDVAAPIHRDIGRAVETAAERCHAGGTEAVRRHLRYGIGVGICDVDVAGTVHGHTHRIVPSAAQLFDAPGVGTVRWHLRHRLVVGSGCVNVTGSVYRNAIHPGKHASLAAKNLRPDIVTDEHDLRGGAKAADQCAGHQIPIAVDQLHRSGAGSRHDRREGRLHRAGRGACETARAGGARSGDDAVVQAGCAAAQGQHWSRTEGRSLRDRELQREVNAAGRGRVLSGADVGDKVGRVTGLHLIGPNVAAVACRARVAALVVRDQIAVRIGADAQRDGVDGGAAGE